MNWQSLLVYLGLWSLGALPAFGLAGFEAGVGVGLVVLLLLGSLGLATVTDSMFGTIAGTLLGFVVAFGMGSLGIFLAKELGWPHSAPLVLATVGCLLAHWALGPRLRLLDWFVLVAWILTLAIGGCISERSTWSSSFSIVSLSGALMAALPVVAGRLGKKVKGKPSESMSFDT